MSTLPKTNVGVSAVASVNPLTWDQLPGRTLPRRTFFGNVVVFIAYHNERVMPGQPQDTLLLAALSPQERTRALERYRMLQPCVEHDVPLTHVAHHYGLPLRTAQRWLAQYRREGLAGLVRHERSDRGHLHGMPPEFIQMIEGLALSKPVWLK